MTIALTIGATILAMFLLFGIAASVLLVYRHKKAEMETTREFCAAVARLNTVMPKLTEAVATLADVPKYISGHAKAAAAIAREVTELRRSVATFSNLVTNPTTKEPALTVPTEEEADRSFLIAEMLADHPEYTREQAEQMAQAEQDYRLNTPAISME